MIEFPAVKILNDDIKWLLNEDIGSKDYLSFQRNVL